MTQGALPARSRRFGRTGAGSRCASSCANGAAPLTSAIAVDAVAQDSPAGKRIGTTARPADDRELSNPRRRQLSQVARPIEQPASGKRRREAKPGRSMAIRRTPRRRAELVRRAHDAGRAESMKKENGHAVRVAGFAVTEPAAVVKLYAACPRRAQSRAVVSGRAEERAGARSSAMTLPDDVLVMRSMASHRKQGERHAQRLDRRSSPRWWGRSCSSSSASAQSARLQFVNGSNPVDPAASLVVVALAHGVALAVLVSALGAVSGAHFNPAVTFAVWVAGQIPGDAASAYVLAQLIGAMLAAWLAWAVIPSDVFRANVGIPRLFNGVTPLAGMAIEAVLTRCAAIAVFGTAVDPRAPKVGGLAIGLAVAARHPDGRRTDGRGHEPGALVRARRSHLELG